MSSLSPDPHAYRVALRSKVWWMWADAGLLPLPGMRKLAKVNPLRWSESYISDIEGEFGKMDKGHQRSVRLHIASNLEYVFKSPQEAAHWIRASRQMHDEMNVATLGPPVIERKHDYPHYWTNQDDSPRLFKDVILMPPESLSNFQSLFNQTYGKMSTRDRPCPAQPPCSQEGTRGGCPCSRYGGCPGLPVRYKVCQVLRLEDSKCWSEYTNHRRSIQQLRSRDVSSVWPCEPPGTNAPVEGAHDIFAPLDSQSNEMYLFHGTNTRSALKIASEDVRLNLSKSGGALGPGLYLSESVTKSDEYASDTVSGTAHGTSDPYYQGVFAMLVMRVTMGKVHQTKKFFTEPEKNNVMNALREQQFDSILADRRKHAGTYREFCVFKKEQIYSEYVVFYERVYHTPVGTVPRPMSLHARGRLRQGAFQFQVPSYWVNFHKNPHVESFREEHHVRPRGVALLQRTLQLFSGGKELKVRNAIRLEDSSMWNEYVAQKLGIQARGVLSSGWSMDVFPDGIQAAAFSAAASKVAFSLENMDENINETFLWCAIQPGPNDEVPSFGRTMAPTVREMRRLSNSPWDCLTHANPWKDNCKVLCLCRAVCGEIRGTPGARVYDSVIEEGISKRRYYIFADERQIYPEMMVWVDSAPTAAQRVYREVE